jgi:hypothetical protein
MARRYRSRGSGRFAGTAVLAGILFAAYGGHATAGSHQAAATAVHAVHAPAGSNEALANQMAVSRYGWSGVQATCLDDLWTEESGFSSTAYNSSSGATGIPQLLPGAHAIPANWSDPAVQIRWGLDYIKGRYGTPCAAWSFERSHVPNWY